MTQSNKARRGQLERQRERERGQRPKTLTRIKTTAVPAAPKSVTCPHCQKVLVVEEQPTITMHAAPAVCQAMGTDLIMSKGMICEHCAKPIWEDDGLAMPAPEAPPAG